MSTRERWRAPAANLVRLAARAVGQDLVARNYYSPIPDLENVPTDVYDRRAGMPGIEFDLETQLSTLRALEPYLAEFTPPSVWDREMYGPIESDVLHAMVRSQRPRRIIELGSGVSSLIIAAAATRNADEGSPVSYTAYDPFARDFIRAGVAGLEWIPKSAADVALTEFESLGDGDILFVDTTHTVKLGSEVNYIILDALPAIGEGVLVHVHDVFLPYEYPRGFFEHGLYWAEQYLLQAFLTQNPKWEIYLALHALVRERPADISPIVRTFEAGAGPGAFWIRRR